MKKYPVPDDHEEFSLEAIEAGDLYRIIGIVREGIPYQTFQQFTGQSPFSLAEWSAFLGLSERTLQRYKKEKKKFDRAQSERIIEIALLMQKGIDVFGDENKFRIWMDSPIPVLGMEKPKMLLDSNFGIQLLHDLLTRIEYGIFA